MQRNRRPRRLGRRGCAPCRDHCTIPAGMDDAHHHQKSECTDTRDRRRGEPAFLRPPPKAWERSNHQQDDSQGPQTEQDPHRRRWHPRCSRHRSGHTVKNTDSFPGFSVISEGPLGAHRHDDPPWFAIEDGDRSECVVAWEVATLSASQAVVTGAGLRWR